MGECGGGEEGVGVVGWSELNDMPKPRTLVLSLAIALVACIALVKACSVSDERIRSKRWQFFDDPPDICGGCEFLYFESGRFALRNDTVFLKDSAIAVVECAYHKYSGRDRLLLRCIPSNRVVEYIDI